MVGSAPFRPSSGPRWKRCCSAIVVAAGCASAERAIDYAIRDEMNRRGYLRGTLGMALSGPNTGGSQFFDVLDHIVQGDRIVRITIR